VLLLIAEVVWHACYAVLDDCDDLMVDCATLLPEAPCNHALLLLLLLLLLQVLPSVAARQPGSRPGPGQ
jgi:hypothetical protein